MEDAIIKLFWVTIGTTGSLIVGVVSFLIRNAISKNATKENIDAKTDLLEKVISHLTKEMDACETKFAILHKLFGKITNAGVAETLKEAQNLLMRYLPPRKKGFRGKWSCLKWPLQIEIPHGTCIPMTVGCKKPLLFSS